MMQESVPMWLYVNGRRIKENLWEIFGIWVKVEWTKTPNGEIFTLTPYRFQDRVKFAIAKLTGRFRKVYD